MKCFRQLLRQPIKFIAGLILMTVAAAIVCVCVGQAMAAQYTAQILDEQFTTVAVPVPVDTHTIYSSDEDFVAPDFDNAVTYGRSYGKDSLQWLEETAQTNPDVVKTIAKHGIISAYIPELTPLNYTQSDFIPENFSTGNNFFYQDNPDAPTGMPYSCAMLVITLEEVSGPVENYMFVNGGDWGTVRSVNDVAVETDFYTWLEGQGEGATRAGYTLSLAGTITDVVSLQEGYRDPTGMTARLEISHLSLEELEALDLEVGQQYIVYGMDYYDDDWALRGYLADDRHDYSPKIDAFDMSKLKYLTPEEIEKSGSQDIARYDGSVFLDKFQVAMMNSVSLTLEADLRFSGNQRMITMKRYSRSVDLRPEASYRDFDGETVTMSWEEFTNRYQIPTIARLDGSVEDFLQSEEGAFWQEALKRDNINNHAFPVIGVDQMKYLADFARENSRITQGRDFTAEELSGGARVCIIHEQVAAENGLKVGDTITLNLYRGDVGLPYEETNNDQFGGLTPTADFYFRTTPIEETAAYTIVGTYRSRDLWTDVAQNEYGFSPNTVFVPETSVDTDLQYSSGILFNTVVLNNGWVEEFQLLAKEAGHKNAFTFYDQGYSEIAVNFHNYDALARQVLTVGAAVYAVILLLFLILFPGTQGKAVATMESLGATRGKRFGHVMLSSFGVVAPATVLGGCLGLLLWQSVADALQASAESVVALQIDNSILVLLALAQLVLAMALTAIIAAWVTASRGLSKRRTK